MRITTKFLLLCYFSLIAMAVGAPRRPRPCAPNCTKSKEGKTGGRKRNRQREKAANEGELVETSDDSETRIEEREMMERFIALDSNGDEFITKKEFKSNTEKGNTVKIFQLVDTNRDKKISREEFLSHVTNITTPSGNCGTFSMTRCARHFTDHLRIEETILSTRSTVSSNGLFCTALQSYVNCIAQEKHFCPELEPYAQRIKRTSTAYRNGGVCPNMDTSKFNAPVPRHSRGQQTDSVTGETRRRSRGSREKRGTKRKTISSQQCLENSFASCHDDLFETLDNTRGCELIKQYKGCISRTSKRCRGADRTYVKKILSGLKHIRQVHLEADMCRLKT